MDFFLFLNFIIFALSLWWWP